jgi:hypothetical protein
MSAADSALAREFNDRLREYGANAVFYKRWYQASWFAITLSVWATLLLAIAGLAWPDDWFSDVALKWIIPILGILVTVGTLVQFAFRLQTKWTSYRHAAEHLKNACMRYRAGLFSADEFLGRMNQIGEWAGRGKKFQRNYLFSFLFGLPPDLQQPITDIAGDLSPCAGESGPNGARFNIPAVITGRLQQQRQWMLRKMIEHRLVYVAFQLAIIAISLGNSWYVWNYGRNFTWVALTTGVSMAIIACRDFLDLDRLVLQYLDTASGLEAIKEEFAGADPEDRVRLKELVHRVEYLLEHESEAWYHQHAGPVAIQVDACQTDAPLANDGRSGQIAGGG